MNPQTAFCPNAECPARGQVGQGNIRIHSHAEQRYRCHECGQTFAATTGTPFYRLQHAPELLTQVVTLLAWGCPPQAIVAAFGLDERTVAAWQARAGQHCQAVHEQLIEQPRSLGEVQADELRVKRQGAIVWMALALQVTTRLWLSGEVSQHRDRHLLRRLIERVRRCAVCEAILFCTDGLSTYVKVIRQVFRDKLQSGGRGRPRLQEWRELLIAQVVKRYAQRRVVAVERRIKHGTAAQVEAVRHKAGDGGVINTAYIERLNATFRQRLVALVRRGRALARQTQTLQHGMFLIGTLYNFCTMHESLRLDCPVATDKWLNRTPAMAAGITDHCWSVKELLAYQVPPPRWRPPKRRGRVSQAMKLTIARWCCDHD